MTPIVPSKPIPGLNLGFSVAGITFTAGFEAGLNFIMNQELKGQMQFISTFGYQAGKRFSAQVCLLCCLYYIHLCGGIHVPHCKVVLPFLLLRMQYYYNPISGGTMVSKVTDMGTGALPFETSFDASVTYTMKMGLAPNISLTLGASLGISGEELVAHCVSSS